MGAGTDGDFDHDPVVKAFWQQRQAALEGPGFQSHGEVLHPHEVRFVERMLEAGHRLRWIPARSRGTDASGRPLPTEDFVWHLPEGDVLVEHKRIRSPRYSTIKDRIKDDAVRGKRCFIVDVGDLCLRIGVLRRLERINVHARSFQIERLWILDRDGIVEVTLAPAE